MYLSRIVFQTEDPPYEDNKSELFHVMDEICDLVSQVSTAQLLSLTGIDHRRLNTLLINRCELKAKLPQRTENCLAGSSSIAESSSTPKISFRKTLGKQPMPGLAKLYAESSGVKALRPNFKMESDDSFNGVSPMVLGNLRLEAPQTLSPQFGVSKVNSTGNSTISFSPPPCGESFFDPESDRPLPSTLATFKHRSANNSPVTTPPSFTFRKASSLLNDSKPSTVSYNQGQDTTDYTHSALMSDQDESYDVQDYKFDYNITENERPSTKLQKETAPPVESSWLLDDANCLPDDAIDDYAASLGTNDCWLSSRKDSFGAELGTTTPASKTASEFWAMFGGCYWTCGLKCLLLTICPIF